METQIQELAPSSTGVLGTFYTESHGAQCEGCGLRVYGKALQIPGIAGLHCSLECVEAHQFGMEACRWCGAEMLAPYTSINSRLCGEDCAENYKAHVSPITGDKTAALGTGQRLSRWLLSRKHGKRAFPKSLAA